MLCAQNYDNRFQFLQVIEDKTNDTFLRHALCLKKSQFLSFEYLCET